MLQKAASLIKKSSYIIESNKGKETISNTPTNIHSHQNHKISYIMENVLVYDKLISSGNSKFTGIGVM